MAIRLSRVLLPPALAVAILVGAQTAGAAGIEDTSDAPARTLPPFPHNGVEHWVNSEPLHTGDLLGQGLLIEVWTTS